MKRFLCLGTLSLFFCLTVAAQQKAPQTPPTLQKVMDTALKNVEGEFVSAAEAMPDDKYDYAPTQGEFKGVRTFALQVRHVATTNYMIGAAMLGEKAPVDVSDENGSDSINTKDAIVKYLKDSFAYMHKAEAGLNEKNATEWIQSPFGSGKTTRLAMATLVFGHCFDHYGQMVEYLRSNGIVPPASRPQQR